MSSSDSSSPSPHRKVHVNLGTRSYDILIGRGVTQLLGDLLKERHINGELVAIADTPFLRAWAINKTSEEMFGISEGHIKFINYKIPLGESAKSLNIATELLSELARLKLSRSSIVLALGGGVIGDLAGFVAASYLRGISFVQIPTTLLAMVDSSVGGKTGVNLPEGKNLVGAFHQPKLVVADLGTLDTLPPREFSAGMAEVIKYGAIRDKALFDRVSKTVQPSDKDLDAIVETCVKIKAHIVENDEFETKGERALLNFGHTIGHAIEKATGYNTHLHGEAISIGMRAAAWLSVWQTGLPEADAHRIEDALTANGLPINLKLGIDPQLILDALGNDKKVTSDGKNRWVLLNKLGEATSGHEVPDELVKKALALLSVE